MSDGDNQLSNLSDRIESLLGPKAHAKRLAGNLMFYLSHVYGPVMDSYCIQFPITNVEDTSGQRTRTQVCVAVRVGSDYVIPIKISARSLSDAAIRLSDKVDQLVAPLVEKKTVSIGSTELCWFKEKLYGGYESAPGSDTKSDVQVDVLGG